MAVLVLTILIMIGWMNGVSSICDSVIDLVLVLDNSGSMSTGKVPQQLKAVATQIVSQFELRPTAVRVGVVSFASSASESIQLSSDQGAVSEAIQAIQTPNGWTDMGAGLTKASEMFTDHPRAAQRIVFLMSDGQQTCSLMCAAGCSSECSSEGDAEAISKASRLKSEGIELFVGGFSGASEATLSAMASSPSADHSYYGRDLADVQLQATPTPHSPLTH